MNPFSKNLRWLLEFAGIVAIAAAFTAWPAAAADPYEVWVLTDSSQIFWVDPITLTPSSFGINLSTPSTSAAPNCLTQSTVPDRAATAFVTQGPLLRVIDVATRSVSAPQYDFSTMLGIPGLVLHGCDSSVTREFQTSSGTTHLNYLFLGASLPNGQASWIILDQRKIIDQQTDIVVATGILHPGAEVFDVEVLETPEGNAFLRALYTIGEEVAGVDRVTTIPLVLQEIQGTTPKLGTPQSIDLPTAGFPRSGLKIGAAFDRDLQIQPGWFAGSLTNLDLGFSCSFPFDLAHLSVVGAGPDSYTIFATAPFVDQVVIVDPNTCAYQAVTVGDGPAAIVPRNRYFWDGLFVANQFSDNVGFVHPDLSYQVIPLPQGAGPIDVDVIQQPSCSVNELLLDRVATDPDLIQDDIALQWTPIGCPAGKEVFVWCACSGFPGDCPCACDCATPPIDPACACPLVPIPAPSRGPQNYLVNFPPNDLPSLNPWKKLENTTTTGFNHENVPPGGTWFYLVTGSDVPPSVPPVAEQHSPLP